MSLRSILPLIHDEEYDIKRSSKVILVLILIKIVKYVFQRTDTQIHKKERAFLTLNNHADI